MHDPNYVFTHLHDGTLSTELCASWTNLTKTLAQPAFYHEPQWFRAYLASQPDETVQTCHFLKLSYAGQDLAIFPLQYTTSTRFGVTLRTWQICWPGDMGVNDFIVPPAADHHHVLVKLIDYLRTQRERYPWDLLLLQNVPQGAGIARLLNNHTSPLRVSIYNHDSKFLVCGPDYEASVANVSGKFKKNNRRKYRNLEKLGTVTTAYYDTPDALDAAFEQFLEVEEANWKGREGTALRQDAVQLRFYRALLDEYAGTGRIAIHMLNLDDKPVAAQFALICGDTFYLLKIGYNAEHHAYGPGGLLLDETIRRFSGHPQIRHISFVTGAKWNDDWAPQAHRVYHHYVYNNTVKGTLCGLAEKTKSVLRMIKHKLKNHAGQQ